MSDNLPPLSEREIEVLKLVATGATNQQIARALIISPNTVKVHLRNIFEKLGVQSRTEATMEAVRRGWVSVPGAGERGSVGAAGQGSVGAGEDGGGRAGEQGEAVATTEAAAGTEVNSGRPPIATWQRWYMLAAALTVIVMALAPGWLKSRGQAAAISPFTDLGQPQTAPAPRPAQVVRWTSRAALPEPRSRLALVADGTKLYAIGGETAAGVSDQVAIYDPLAEWSAGPAKPVAVANVAAAFFEGRIYVPGGVTATGAVTTALEVLDVQTGGWITRAPLPAPRAAYALAEAGGKLYLFGGWDGAAYRAETFVYDPRADVWSAAAAMPRPRAFLAAASLDGLIYVVGGYDGRNELDTVAVYDPSGAGTAGGPWFTRAALGQARGGLGLVALGTRLYAVGGGWSSALAFNEQYDVPTAAWSRIGTPVTGQWRNLGLAALGGKLYAVGGWSGSYLASVEEYQALIRQLLPFGSKGG